MRTDRQLIALWGENTLAETYSDQELLRLHVLLGDSGEVETNWEIAVEVGRRVLEDRWKAGTAYAYCAHCGRAGE